MTSMLVDDGDRDPRQMAAALRRLPSQRKPSERLSPEVLGGLDEVNKLARRWLDRTRTGGRARVHRRA